MKKQKVNILYERLSKDDELQGTSNSILNQKQLLEEYAERNGLIPYLHIQDDGFTGTNWNRPGWQELISMVEADEVNSIVIKDGTRLGRDYLRAGLYREMFRERGVRLIAVNDGFDSERGEDDFTPFREIMAEFYARDTSKKIKSVLSAKGRSGKPTTNTPPYGFVKDPDDKYKWLVDETAAAVVRRVFQMAVDGMGAHQIARVLTEEKTERPSYYSGKNGQGTRRNDYDRDNPYIWYSSTIAKLLRTLEYCGHLVNLRTTTTDFKSRKSKVKPQDEWLIFENHHEAIISQEVFDTVQKLRETVRRFDTLGYANPLTGLLWCADCGEKLYNYRRAKPRKPTENKVVDVYQCSTYKLGKNKHNATCTVHHISTEDVRDIILDALRKTSGYVLAHESEFVEQLRQSSTAKQGETAAANKKQIAQNDKRIADINRIFQSLYEDKALGKLSQGRFDEMTETYEQEIAALKSQNVKLQSDLDEINTDKDRTDKFLALIRRYTHFEELTTPMLNEFVEKIVVHECEWSEGFADNGRPLGTRTQRVDIYFKHIGCYTAPDMRTQEEIEVERLAAEKLEQKRKRNREYMRKMNAEKRAAKTATLENRVMEIEAIEITA